MPALNWVRCRDSGGDLSTNSANWTESWNVYPFSPTPGTPAWLSLLNDNPALAPGTLHPIISGAYAADFRPRPLSSRSNAWHVDVTYRNGNPVDPTQPPATRPAVIELAHESVDVPTYTWQDGTPILTAAGELIEGLTRTENHWVFHVQKNVVAVPAWSLSYADAVNSDAIVIRGLAVAAHHLLLKDLRVGNTSAEVINGVSYLYFPVSFSLVYNPRTWKTKIAHRGLYQKRSGKYIACADSDGNPATTPMFLDANGQQLTLPLNPAAVTWREGWNHQLLPFAALPLA